jgi:hypothetical protein
LSLRIAVAALAAFAVAVPAAHAAVAVSPLPGTPDANPRTQISMLGVAPSKIVAVRVAGARTGVHAGRLRAYSRGRGASFLPRAPFAAGERVAVRVRIKGRAKAIRTSFTVARLGVIPPVLDLPATQPDKLQHFATQPGLLPPVITVNRGGAATDDPILLTPLPSPVIHPGNVNSVSIAPVGPGGPMIVDGRGRLVWFRQLTMPTVAANLDVQRYRGKPVLTWWEGPVTTQAFGLGRGVIADSSYRTVAEVHTGNGYAMDIHELRLTAAGDALVTVYSPVIVDGTPVLDALIQRIDIPTGLVMWEWHALGHIPLKESYATPENSAAYDAFHINSVFPMGDGRLLVSARDTAAIYAVDATSGKIAWRLGGKASSFTMGPGARFWLQHDARPLPGDRVSLFDDEAGPPQKAPASRGLILKLNHEQHTATVARSVTRVPDTSAQSEGSTQLLGDGSVFVGFGAEGAITQFSPAGTVTFDAEMPDGDGSYRMIRAPWRGTPPTRPAVVARRVDPAHVTVAVSWNGATGVARWRVLAGGAAVATVPSDGFETTATVASAAATFTVRALDAHGHVLGTSAPVTAP